MIVVQPKWNTRITINRSVSTNPRLEPMAVAGTPAVTNQYAWLSEMNQVVTNDSGQHPRVVLWANLRVLSTLDIRKNDRVFDQLTGVTWIVDSVIDWNRNYPLNMGKRCILRSV